MSITILRIKNSESEDWYDLPVPMEIKGGSQVLDSSESGRDNNTGYMFRDIIRDDVATYTCSLPDGINNTQMAQILDILLAKSYLMEIPDVRTGTIKTRTFYTATCEPEIDHIYTTNPPYWEYKDFSFTATQI